MAHCAHQRRLLRVMFSTRELSTMEEIEAGMEFLGLIKKVQRLSWRAVGARHFDDVAQDALLRLLRIVRHVDPPVLHRLAGRAVAWAASTYLRRERRHPACGLGCDSLVQPSRPPCSWIVPATPPGASWVLAACLQAFRDGSTCLADAAARTGLPKRLLSGELARFSRRTGNCARKRDRDGIS